MSNFINGRNATVRFWRIGNWKLIIRSAAIHHCKPGLSAYFMSQPLNPSTFRRAGVVYLADFQPVPTLNGVSDNEETDPINYLAHDARVPLPHEGNRKII